MKTLPELLAAYIPLDEYLEREKDAALDDTARMRLGTRQILNDQAYFLLCWGQLEAETDEKCRSLIRQRRASADWQVRRGWDLYNPDERRMSGLSFDERASFILDRGDGRGGGFATAMKHYELRNRIAHGKLETTRVDVVGAVEDFHAVQSAMTRHA